MSGLETPHTKRTAEPQRKWTTLSDKAMRDLSKAIVAGYRGEGKTASLQNTRILPSTRTELGDGTYQVMANTFVSVTPSTKPGTQRPEIVNSVLTMKRVNGRDVLQAVKVPVFERNQYFANSVVKVAQS